MHLRKRILGSFFVLSLTAASLLPSFAVAKNENDRRIIVWADGVSDSRKAELLSRRNARELKKLNRLSVARLAKADEQALQASGDVVRIEEDAIVTTQARAAKPTPPPPPPQPVPWNIDRINAETVWPLGNTADTVKVAVLDTGISLTHPDLAANIKGGVNTIIGGSYNDDNGHGSHVAGIIGALNNTIGVVGTAPNVDLYAIKALDKNGSGYLSDIIEGLQWAQSHGIQVVNMSLGTTANIQSFHDAITAAHNAGIVLVAAAGNNGAAVNYPGAYPEVIGVGATDSNNQIASWSSRGPEIDVVAPGVNILSTYKGANYAYLSGTSMATPHVTGAAALMLGSNASLTPDQVRNKLMASATDLGTSGFDTIYGAGLVNALAAVTP